MKEVMIALRVERKRESMRKGLLAGGSLEFQGLEDGPRGWESRQEEKSRRRSGMGPTPLGLVPGMRISAHLFSCPRVREASGKSV